MNNGLVFVGGLLLGAAGGSFLTHKLLKDKYAQMAEEEIKNVREALLADSEKWHKREDDKKKEIIKKKAEEAVKTYSSTSEPVGTPVVSTPVTRPPYEIAPSLFDDESSPMEQKMEFRLYEDDVILDKYDNRIQYEDLYRMMGKEVLNHFGDYEDDRICVRNEFLKTDFALLRIPTTYAAKVVLQK